MTATSNENTQETSSERTLGKATIEEILTTALMVPMGDPVRAPESCVMGLPTILWGAPGIGKSRRIEAVASSLGLPCEIVLPSTRQPEDASGAAMPDGKGGVCFVSLLPGVARLKENIEGVLVLDELSCARPAVQAAFLGVILDRRVGDEKLPPGVRVLAAANDADDAAGGWELEPPLANRLCHIKTPAPTIDEWTKWLVDDSSGSTAFQGDIYPKLVNGWDTSWAWAKAMRVGYGNSNKSDKALHNLPESGSPERGKAWPSPRSWEMALRAMATCRAIEVCEDTMNTFVCGCVGKGIGTEFLEWVQKADLPAIDDVLTKGWEADTARLDRTVTVYTSIALHLGRLLKEDPEEAMKLVPMGLEVPMQGWDKGLGDIVVPALKQLVQAGFTTDKLPPKPRKRAEQLCHKIVASPLGIFMVRGTSAGGKR